MAVKVIDYLRDASGDLIIENGDFKKGEATTKHQRTLMLANPGDFKYAPTVGIGIVEFLKDDVDPDEMQSVIQREYEKDGMRIKKLVLNSFTDIETIANYE